MRVLVRVCNVSVRVVEIPFRTLIGLLHGFSVVDIWIPDLSVKSGKRSPDIILEDLCVSIDTDSV